MNKYNLEKLEFYKIINELSNYCITSIGKNLAFNLLPSNNPKKVVSLLQETEEAINLSTRNSMPPIQNIDEISIPLKKAKSKQTLSCKALLDFANIFIISRKFKRIF